MKINQDFQKSTKICGIEKHLSDKSYFFVEKNKILGSNFVKGINAKAKEISNGVEARVIVKKGVKLKDPIFFCFGLMDKEGQQFVVPEIVIEDDAEVTIIAHCTFPYAQKVEHKMEAFFRVGKRAKFFYEEHHYHGSNSGANVIPNLKIEIDEDAFCENNFNLIKGTAGKTKINLEAQIGKRASFISNIKTLGKNKNDQINISEKVYLLRQDSRSIIKMRAAAKNGGRVEMQGETYAQADGSQGHVDCQEIVIGEGSVARAVPIVQASHPGSRVTHEAAVGKINQKELEALMTKGLDEDQATEMIVNAMLNN